MKKKVVIIVHTEYHLIVALSVINQFYFDNSYDILIYKISPIGGKRLNQSLNMEGFSWRFQEIWYEAELFKDLMFKNKLDDIANKKPDIFIFFQEHHQWIYYLIYQLKKYDTKIILAPDGAKIYENRKLTFYQRLRFSFKSFIYRMSNRMYTPLNFIGAYYGSYKEIDGIMLESSESFCNKNNKNEILISVLSNQCIVSLVNKVFGFKQLPEEILGEKLIVFFDVPFTDSRIMERKRTILRDLSIKFPSRKIVIKSHPLLDSAFQYKNIGNVFMLSNDFPAEVYMSNMCDAIFLGIVSTAMFYYNASCKYYWIYPLFSDILDYKMLSIPKRHIKVVERISDIEG